MKKLIIAGGRYYEGTLSDFKIVKSLIKKYNINLIVSGGAPGADTFGEKCARILGLKVKRFLAAWDDLDALPFVAAYHSDGSEYNLIAGFNRNVEMAKFADYVCLFPGGNGTSHMRRTAEYYHTEIIYDAEPSFI